MKCYFIKIALRGISPMVWRRLRVPGTTSLAMLHECIQISYGWDDEHLHQFHIHGKDYGINYSGGLCYEANVHTIYLESFGFDVGDKFTYEYNFFEHIIHDIRIEKIQDLSLVDGAIVCLNGSGMFGASKYDVMQVENNILKWVVRKNGLLTVKDIVNFREKLNRVKFNKYQVNTSLASMSAQ